MTERIRRQSVHLLERIGGGVMLCVTELSVAKQRRVLD